MPILIVRALFISQKDAGLDKKIFIAQIPAQRSTVVPSQNLEIGTQGGKTHVFTYQSKH